tara:strand:- start:10325 stop:12058 length:1734 start_codon:yes stop_codon:yes gene_type:complete
MSANISNLTTLKEGLLRCLGKGHTLRPFLRSLELAIHDSNYNDVLDKSTSTVFSCDSFCEPHLNTQLYLFSSLKRLGYDQTNFLNIPLSHFISGTPDSNVLNIAANPSSYHTINDKLIEQQTSYLSNILPDDRISINHDDILAFSLLYTQAVQQLPLKLWESLPIFKHNLHEYSFNDLCITYKCPPSFASSPDQPFYSHYILSNIFNLWLLSVLTLLPSIGKTCFYMSFYTPSNIFSLFCDLTNRCARYFENPLVPLPALNDSSKKYVTILKKPTAYFGLTRHQYTDHLSKLEISSSTYKQLDLLLQSRLEGIGSHNYSSSIHSDDPTTSWISDKKNQGKLIVTAFTSSTDEATVGDLGRKHQNTDVSHFSSPVFPSQDQWLVELISYFQSPNLNSVLLIRVHPRLAPDKRGHGESPVLANHISSLKSAIGNSDNIRLIEPHHSTSSYKVGLLSDLILNGWSTIGLEFALLMKPVCNAFYKCTMGAAMHYPVHINTPPLKSTQDYFDRISRLLSAISNEKTLPESDLISRAEAAKAFLAYSLVGLVDLNNDDELRLQISSPSLLTPLLLRLISSDWC